jgi:chorismate synthase
MLRFLSGGESHGKCLVGIIEGMPAGLFISKDDINIDLKRRQGGYGRGGRMKIESDEVEILSGIRWGKTIGSPIALYIKNRDWNNWEKTMNSESQFEVSITPITKPRPGHADLAGFLKYGHSDIRNVLERSSARETAIRVAIGAVAKKFLKEFNIFIGSFVCGIGSVNLEIEISQLKEDDLLELHTKAESSKVRCPSIQIENKMIELIDEAIKNGNSLGGRFVVFAVGVPPGLGSYVHWDRKLDGIIAQAFMSIQAIKAVEIGDGVDISKKFGSEVMDEIFYDGFFYRKTNHMGGIEGGMSNGMPIVIKATMKPIPTLRKPLKSIDVFTKERVDAAYERSDICAVSAASVIGEAVLAWSLAQTFLEKFSGDNIEDVRKNYEFYLNRIGIK